MKNKFAYLVRKIYSYIFSLKMCTERYDNCIIFNCIIFRRSKISNIILSFQSYTCSIFRVTIATFNKPLSLFKKNIAMF